MYLSWFIFLLFCRYSTSFYVLDPEDSEENEFTTKSFLSQVTTTNKSDEDSYFDMPDYYNAEDDSEEKDTIQTTMLSTTTSRSSSSKIILTPNVIRETSTTDVIHPYFSTTEYDFNRYMFTYTTSQLDPNLIAIYQAKANRERLLLKIFTITVSIGMLILAIVLITIHLRRKRQRYHGYRTPANKQSTLSDDIRV